MSTHKASRKGATVTVTLPEPVRAMPSSAPKVNPAMARAAAQRAAVLAKVRAAAAAPAPAVAAKPYAARVYTPSTMLTYGSSPAAKPGTVPAWVMACFAQVLAEQAAAGGPKDRCTVGQLTEKVIASHATCPSKSKPARGGVWAQFVAGYVRGCIYKRGQLAVVPTQG